MLWADIILLVFSYADEQSLLMLGDCYKSIQDYRHDNYDIPILMVGVQGKVTIPYKGNCFLLANDSVYWDSFSYWFCNYIVNKKAFFLILKNHHVINSSIDSSILLQSGFCCYLY